MRIELLAPADYPQLLGIGGMTASTLPSPDTSRIIVARREDDATIVAYWVAQAVIHVEPIYLGLEGLGNGKLFQEMLPHMLAALSTTGDNTFYAFAADESMVQYALRLGLTHLPYLVFQGSIPPPPETT